MDKHNIHKITVLGGYTKDGEEEPIRSIEITTGEILVLVGPTGSGKSMLLSDIELLACADTPSKRMVLINDAPFDACRNDIIAQLSQTMNFVMDTTVEDFLLLHASSRDHVSGSIVQEVIERANTLAGEPINRDDYITMLSGGQSRALMIADIALISNAPIVLVDEIENAGIDKLLALQVLSDTGKIVIVASHDPVIMLMAERRIVMQNGGMKKVLSTTTKEAALLHDIIEFDQHMFSLRESLRTSGTIEAV